MRQQRLSHIGGQGQGQGAQHPARAIGLLLHIGVPSTAFIEWALPIAKPAAQPKAPQQEREPALALMPAPKNA